MKANETTTFCVKTGLNHKYCVHCHNETQERKTRDRSRRPMAEKIHEILSDNGVHNTREIAEQAGLMKAGKYPDVQRAIRLLRQEGHPVECIDNAESAYVLLTPEKAEATRFWQRQAEKTPKTKAITDLEAIVAQLKEENKFLTEYAQERDAEIESMKAGIKTNAG